MHADLKGAAGIVVLRDTPQDDLAAQNGRQTMDRMSNNKVVAILINGLLGWLIALLGLALVGVSLFADSLGIGGQPGVIGWKQWAGVSAGSLSTIFGLWIGARSHRSQMRAGNSLPLVPLAGGGDESPVYDSGALRIPFVHEFVELSHYRYLLWNLVTRDLKVRYKRSFLGFLWAMINPLLTMAVMAAVFVNLFRVRIENYPVYLLAGILLWRLFAGGTTAAMRSVLGNMEISKKIYVPPSVFVAASIGSALINLLYALGPFLILAMLLGVEPHPTWVLLPFPILMTTFFSFGVGLIVAALSVSFADMLDIYEVSINAFFYLTPIMYPLSILPPFIAKLENLNPMHLVIDTFRTLLIDGSLPGLSLSLSAMAIALLVMVFGWSFFTRLADEFPYHG